MAALQSVAGNRVAARAAQRQSVVRRLVQRHPEHADEQEVQRFVDAVIAQRHPEHADEQEVQRSADGAPIQRESKKARKARMETDYGIVLTGNLPDSMLKKVDSILKLLPRAHTKGNAALTEITGGGGIGGSASAYDSGAKRMEINTPPLAGDVKMPTWLYLALDKGTKWQRAMMDEGAMADFNIDGAQDAALGLGGKGKREVMAGVSDKNAKGNLVSWTLRHENGHAVDEQIKFTETRGKLAQFGGWRMYETDAQYIELATALLEKSGFSATEMAKRAEGETPLSLVARKLSQGSADRISNWAEPFARALGVDEGVIGAKFDALVKTMKIAMAHPWTFGDGGGDLVKHGERMYHRDHYDNWVSYLAAARGSALSNYQFSSPGEWFAEVYAAMYDGQKKSSARATLDAPVVAWFTQNLGPPTHKAKDAAQAHGKLEDNSGNLKTLGDLDDAMVNALSDPARMSTVKLADLPADLRDDVGHLQGF
jgi:hypothetical protein